MDRPEDNSGRRERHPERTRESENYSDRLADTGRFAKRLLNNWGTVWLFEICHGELVSLPARGRRPLLGVQSSTPGANQV
jgi:hypothetical protein